CFPSMTSRTPSARTTSITSGPGWSGWRSRIIAAGAGSIPSKALRRSATGRPAREWAQHFDTVSICFSKGLGAPIGSALAGSAEAIRHARKLRKVFGGGMRQSGIVAAAALYALENHVDRLAEDHAGAQVLAAAFQNTEGFALDSGPVETNLVWVRVDPALGSAAEVVAYLRSRGILVAALGSQVIRACTHLDLTCQDIEYAASVIRQVEPAMITAVTLVY